LKVCSELEILTKEIAEKGTSIIPEFGYDKLFNMSEFEKRGFKERECFVMRGLISEEQATKYFEDLKDLIKNNKENITGKSSSCSNRELY
jgi:polyhydroxyalkanoate synthesis regulator phasin